MIVTSDKNRCFNDNMKRIIQNYNIIKYWAKYGTNIKLKSDSFWKWHHPFKTTEPYLCDVCKHILYTWIHIAKKEYRDHKYEMIPGKWHSKQAQLFSRIIRKEFIHTFDNGIKEVDIELDFDYLFNRYPEAQNIYANTNIFKIYFERFYERYGNENRVVKVHDKDNFINVVKQYYKL